MQRIHLPQPLSARLGPTEVALVDVSVLGARVEHSVPIVAGGRSRISFRWNDELISTDCKVVRSRIERFSVGTAGTTVYHSGLEFEDVIPHAQGRLKNMVASFIRRALEEQKMNALGTLPVHDTTKMPIFRFGGQLTSDAKSDSGYVSYQLQNNLWRTKRTYDPGQPLEGFTIAAIEDNSEAELLCQTYEKSDREGRRLIQLFAQLSIADEDGCERGRFEP